VKFPAYTDLQATSKWSVGAISWDGGARLLPRLGDTSLFVCPSASGIGATNGEVANDGYFAITGSVYTATNGAAYAAWPAAPKNAGGQTLGNVRATLISYVINSKLMAANESYTGVAATDLTSPPRRLPMTKLKPGSEAVFMTEMRHASGELPKWADAYYQSQGGAAGRISSRKLDRVKADYQRFTARHREGGNLLFVDGHVAWFSQRDVLTAGKVGSDMNRPGKFLWNPRGPEAP
jgi:prepilin-type processing-associated H-X9-DG protein